MAKSEISLDIYPTERAELSDNLLAGKITEEEYWAEHALLEEESERECVRLKMEKALFE